MAEKTTGRIEATHVGSLIRPPELVEILEEKEHGRAYDEQQYETVLRDSVADVVRKQAEVGIDVVSDGEYGKSVSWSRYIRERIAGFELREDAEMHSVVAPGTDKTLFPEFYEEYEATQGFVGSFGNWVCVGPISYTGQDALQRDIDNLKAALEGVEVRDGFLPVVAPASVVPWRRDEHYDSEEEFVFAVADALNEEYRMIVEAGLMVQIDDAFLATMYDTTMGSGGSMREYREWAELRTEALVRALKDVPEDRSRYHVCWGSWNAPHVGDIALKEIVDLILRVPVGAYALEQGNPRHEHEWRVWEEAKLPEGRKLIPGVVSHVTNVVEHPELVAERLVRLAGVVGRDSVIAGTDCGFAQGPFVRRVHPSVMWAKLDTLAEGAKLASDQLWKK